MHGRRFEQERLAGEQGMFPAGIALQNAAGEGELSRPPGWAGFPLPPLEPTFHRGAENALQLRGIDRNRVAAGRWIDRRLAADDGGLVGADPDVGQRMRYAEVTAHLEHPVEEAIEAARGQVEHARD